MMRIVRTPPQKAPFFKATPTSIKEDISRLIEQSRKVQNQVAKIHPDAATFANILLPLGHAENALNLESHVIVFYKDISPDPEVRDASREARNLLDNFKVEAAMREDVFRSVDAVSKQGNKDLDGESLYFMEKKHLEFIQNGLKLEAGTKRGRFKEIRSRLSQLADEFRKNLAESNTGTGVWFTYEELEGVPEDIVSGLEEGKDECEGKLRLSFKEHHLFPALRYARNPETRKRYFIANENKCVQNVAVLKEAVLIRDEAAGLLGYPNHAAFRLQNMMARNPETVNTFLEDLESRLFAGGAEEVDALKKLKKRDVESRGEMFDGQYFLWDHPFYDRLMLETEYSIDHQKIAEYFPLQTTLTGLLDIFQQLFGLHFEEVNTTGPGIAEGIVWHEDVQMFNVWDDESLGNGFVGHLYLDLFPRDGKYGHASSFNLVPGFIREDGSRQYPANALVCNFTKPSSKRPSLLKHDELVTLFHELGHGIHDLVAKTTYSRFHGFETVVDFGEAPSQMLENWCWTASCLKMLSKHYSSLSPEYLESWKQEHGKQILDSRPPVQISDDVISSLIEAKHINSAIFNLRQVAFAVFSMAIHHPESHDDLQQMNVAKEFNEIRRRIIPLAKPESPEGRDEWGHGAGKFGHVMMEDYDACYYSYLFSKVYSTELFYSVFREDPMNAEAGRRYRSMILEKGGSQNEMKTLTDFLGRAPKMEPFYEEIGLL